MGKKKEYNRESNNTINIKNNDMEFIKIELSVPKESGELIQALSSILRDAIAGKKLDAVLGNMQELFKAAQGLEKLPEEVKSKNLDDLIAFTTKKMTEAVYKGAQGSEVNKAEL